MGQTIIKLNHHRKFHDAWAAMLFIMLSVLVLTYTVLSFPAPENSVLTLEGRAWLLLRLFLFNLALFALETLLTFVILVCYPKFAIYSSLIIIAALSLVVGMLGGIGGVVFGVLTVFLMFCLYFFSIKPHINYIAAVLSVCARILAKYIVQALSVFLGINSLLLAQLVCFSIAMSDESSKHTVLAVLLVLQAYWSIANCAYFFQVFISAIVVNHINKSQENRPVVSTSLKWSMYAFGSICFGGLLLAIVQTCRFFISQAENRNRRRNPDSSESGGSILTVLLLFIIRIILSLLESIVKEMNRMVYSYIALHGTPYKESISEAFGVITAHNYRGLASVMGVDYVLLLFSLIALLTFLVTNLVLTGINNAVDVICGVAVACLFLVLYEGIMNMISSGVLTLVYSKIEFAETFKAYDKDLSDMLEKKNTELTGAGDSSSR